MNRRAFVALTAGLPLPGARRPPRNTAVSIRGERFYINGLPTYAGRAYKGMKIEGLLLNARFVQGIFDDLNPATRAKWAYPDTKRWDPNRNTLEFVAAMPAWRKNGLLSFSLNLQGGVPEVGAKLHPWENSAFDADGGLRPAYMQRLAMILDRADELGMAPILGCFYFGQDERLNDEAAVKRAVRNIVQWLLGGGYRNVLLEIDNECDTTRYEHLILRAARVHELIEMARSIRLEGRRLLVGTSFGGGKIPSVNVVKSSDFLLLHGNNVADPSQIAEMVTQSRGLEGFRPIPILFTEDDHLDHMLAAIGQYASWGYFEYGYQCPPVNWSANTESKKAFFAMLKAVVL